jgi:UDP-hydrolysing UDP-N-acetyl-D-glucosamine 2-epimerase
MIGDAWSGEPRRQPTRARGERPRRVLVVTGSRADFGLLSPVMRAIDAHPELELRVVAAGSHLLPPAQTFREVKAAFVVADVVPMQAAGKRTRLDDAEAAGRGISRFARSFAHLEPDWVLVLGDRIEAFAAASAASIAGIGLAHVHGGDRAEGVADEAMRHAITKLAHLHLAATPASAERITRMGERPEHVHVVGSPAIDDLGAIEPLDDETFVELGSPTVCFLMHPIGRTLEHEEHAAAGALEALQAERVLAIAPNHDPGRTGIERAIKSAGVRCVEHLARPRFVALLKRLATTGGLIVGNSSAALIEAAALRLPAVDIGSRQAGRERPPSVVHADEHDVADAIVRARAIDRAALTHPYSDAGAGTRIAALLASVDPHDAGLIRKRNAY